ncbi:hypothetical protein B0T24DRAFT_491666, partial [Lasiosphaeria ovina]
PVLRPRQATESMIKIGTWSENLPGPATPTKRKRNDENAAPSPKPHRTRGANAFLKPNLNWTHFGMSFVVCDVKGSAASDKFVQLAPGMTMAQVYFDCMANFDEQEAKRVGDYNYDLGVYWARSRLLFDMRMSSTENGTSVPQGDRPVGLASMPSISASRLVQVET